MDVWWNGCKKGSQAGSSEGQVQTRLERKRTGPAAWLVVTRRLRSDDSTSEGKSSPDALEHDGRYGYRAYVTPTGVSEVELKEPSLAELARGITAGLGLEASCKRGKGEAGMDAYQGRTWVGIELRRARL